MSIDNENKKEKKERKGNMLNCHENVMMHHYFNAEYNLKHNLFLGWNVTWVPDRFHEIHSHSARWCHMWVFIKGSGVSSWIFFIELERVNRSGWWLHTRFSTHHRHSLKPITRVGQLEQRCTSSHDTSDTAIITMTYCDFT